MAIEQCIYKEGRTATQNEYFDFTAKLFTWKQKTAIHTGKMTHYIPENNVRLF
jgi:hypothetical protein